jgi:hypothetical protein
MKKCSQLAEDSHVFVASVEEARNSSSMERTLRRRLQSTRRRLIELPFGSGKTSPVAAADGGRSVATILVLEDKKCRGAV